MICSVWYYYCQAWIPCKSRFFCYFFLSTGEQNQGLRHAGKCSTTEQNPQPYKHVMKYQLWAGDIAQ